MYVKGKILRKREKSWSGKNIMEQELLRKERSLQQAISCLRDRKRFASSDRMESEVAFVADLYNLTPDEVAKAMDGEEYWCN